MPEVSDQQVEPVAPEESGTASGVSAEQAELLASQFKAVWEVEATDGAALAHDAAVAPVVPAQGELFVGVPSTPEPSAVGLAENASSSSVEPPVASAPSAETEPLAGTPRRLSHQTMIGLAPVSVSPEPHVPQASAEPHPPPVALAPAVLGSEATLPSAEPAAIVASPSAAQSVQQSLPEPPVAALHVSAPPVATPPVANLSPRPLSGWPAPELSGRLQEPLPVARVVTSFDDDLDVSFRPRSSGRKWVTAALIGGICLLLAVATKLLTSDDADTVIPTHSQAVVPTPQSVRRAAQPTEPAPDTNRAGDADRSAPNAARESGSRPQTSRRGRARTDTTVSSAPPAARWRRPRAAKAGAGRTAGAARQTARDSETSTLPAPKGAAGSIVRETPF